MKWGWGVFFVKKSGKGVCFFVKKWSFPQRRVHYVQYQYFLFLHFTYLGVRPHPTHPPAYGPGYGWKFREMCRTNRPSDREEEN